MRAADARRIMHDAGCDDAVAELVASAPPLTAEQRVWLASLFATSARRRAAAIVAEREAAS